MKKGTGDNLLEGSDVLFGRIAAILEQARGNVVRAVNTNMVLAYWLIGREIVEELQRGKERAKYGEQLLSDLSARLAQRYGKGFSVPNLQRAHPRFTDLTREVIAWISTPVPTDAAAK